MTEPLMAPPCFESQAQYDAWVAAEKMSRTPRIPGSKRPNHCWDCTVQYRTQMLQEGRCTQPNMIFSSIPEKPYGNVPCDRETVCHPRWQPPHLVVLTAARSELQTEAVMYDEEIAEPEMTPERVRAIHEIRQYVVVAETEEDLTDYSALPAVTLGSSSSADRSQPVQPDSPSPNPVQSELIAYLTGGAQQRGTRHPARPEAEPDTGR